MKRKGIYRPNKARVNPRDQSLTNCKASQLLFDPACGAEMAILIP